MAKLKKMVSAVGSIKDLNSARAAFDDASRVLPDEAVFPPEDIRPATTAARTLLLRITHAARAQETTSQGDIFAIILCPCRNDFAAVMALNPSAQIESGQSFAAIADEGGWPVIVAMVEDVLGIRVDHVAELESAALGRVVSELDGLPVYSRAAFSAGGTDFVEGTNHLDATTAGIFTSADPMSTTPGRHALAISVRHFGDSSRPSDQAGGQGPEQGRIGPRALRQRHPPRCSADNGRAGQDRQQPPPTSGR